MARRSKTGVDAGLTSIALLGLLAVFLIAKISLTAVIYGGLPCILIALIYFEYVTERPNVTSAAEFVYASEPAQLQTLKNRQAQIIDKRMQALSDARNMNLEFRNGTPFRFDARNPEARRINTRLDHLAGEFEIIGNEISGLKWRVSIRHSDWQETFARWRFYSSIRSSLRSALVIYLFVVVAILFINPIWVQNFSKLLNDWIIFTSKLWNLYGPLIIGFGSSLIIAPIVGYIKFGNTRPRLDDAPEFAAQWLDSDDISTEEFENIELDDNPFPEPTLHRA